MERRYKTDAENQLVLRKIKHMFVTGNVKGLQYYRHAEPRLFTMSLNVNVDPLVMQKSLETRQFCIEVCGDFTVLKNVSRLAVQHDNLALLEAVVAAYPSKLKFIIKHALELGKMNALYTLCDAFSELVRDSVFTLGINSRLSDEDVVAVIERQYPFADVVKCAALAQDRHKVLRWLIEKGHVDGTTNGLVGAAMQSNAYYCLEILVNLSETHMETMLSVIARGQSDRFDLNLAHGSLVERVLAKVPQLLFQFTALPADVAIKYISYARTDAQKSHLMGFVV